MFDFEVVRVHAVHKRGARSLTDSQDAQNRRRGYKSENCQSVVDV